VLLIYVLGTASVLAFTEPAAVDLVAPTTQLASKGLTASGLSWLLPPLLAFGTISSFAGFSLLFAGVSRLPMVAGWNGVLPPWITRLHPRFGTPTNAIVVVTIIVGVVALVGMSGVGQAEAYQMLINACVVFYALTYVVMFAIPLVSRPGIGLETPWWLRLASASGLVMTVLYIGFSVFPLVAVESTPAFALKIGLVVVGLNLVGVWIFVTKARSDLLIDREPDRIAGSYRSRASGTSIWRRKTMNR
jgi:amino acid transporter